MEILIIYDSFYGNTLKVAEMFQSEFAVLGLQAEIRHVEQTRPEDFEERELIVIGSPTRGFRESQAMAAFLKNKEFPFANKRFFVFDTRISLEDIRSRLLKKMMPWFGYAAQHMEKQLAKRKATIVKPAIGYPVVSSEGPIKPEVAYMIEIDAKKLAESL